MKIESDDYVVLGAAVENESAELTELELNLILGGYEPGYQENNPNGNALDLRGSGHSGAEGAGGQGNQTYPGSDPNGGAGGAGGGQPGPVYEPYPAPPVPDGPGVTLFENWVGRIISGGEEFIRDGSGALGIPYLIDVIVPPKPQA